MRIAWPRSAWPPRPTPAAPVKFTLAYSGQLKRAGVRHVVIIPDNDRPVGDHAEHVATSCHLAGLHVQILTLPDLPEKGDVSDFLRTHTRAELEALARTAPVFPPVDAPGPPMTTPSDQKPLRESQTTKIVREVEEGDTELWHSSIGDAYLTVPVGQHREHHPLRSGAARDYLSQLYFRRARSAASSSAIADAQDTLSAIARFDGPSYPDLRSPGGNGRPHLSRSGRRGMASRGD